MKTNWIQRILNRLGLPVGASISADIATIQADLNNPDQYKADIAALALEATLTAIKGAGFATGTDSLKILSDVLDAITAAGPTEVQMNAARDAVIAAIPAMRGTDNAALASAWTAALATALAAYTAVRGGYLDQLDFNLQEKLTEIDAEVEGIGGVAMRGTDNAALAASWTAALATALGNYTAARGAYLDELAAANIPADIDGLKTSRDRQLFSMDFWSVPQISVVVPAGAANQALPSVVVDIPVGATVVKATAMFKFRMLDNAGAVNKLSGAQHIQVKKGAGAYADAISLVDDQFGIGEATREGGDIVIGDQNLVATVDADETYGFQWTAALADIAGLTFNDVQTGLRIWYSV